MLCYFSTCYIASDEPAQIRESGSFETTQCYVIFLLVTWPQMSLRRFAGAAHLRLHNVMLFFYLLHCLR